jgi:hypothetical protein
LLRNTFMECVGMFIGIHIRTFKKIDFCQTIHSCNVVRFQQLDVFHLTLSIWRFPFDAFHLTLSIWRLPFDVFFNSTLAFDVLHSTFYIWLLLFDVLHSTFYIRRFTFDVLHSTLKNESRNKWCSYEAGFPLSHGIQLKHHYRLVSKGQKCKKE